MDSFEPNPGPTGEVSEPNHAGPPIKDTVAQKSFPAEFLHALKSKVVRLAAIGTGIEAAVVRAGIPIAESLARQEFDRQVDKNITDPLLKFGARLFGKSSLDLAVSEAKDGAVNLLENSLGLFRMAGITVIAVNSLSPGVESAITSAAETISGPPQKSSLIDGIKNKIAKTGFFSRFGKAAEIIPVMGPDIKNVADVSQRDLVLALESISDPHERARIFGILAGQSLIVSGAAGINQLLGPVITGMGVSPDMGKTLLVGAATSLFVRGHSAFSEYVHADEYRERAAKFLGSVGIGVVALYNLPAVTEGLVNFANNVQTANRIFSFIQNVLGK